MTKLTPTQETLLRSAIHQENHAIEWPENIKGGARDKVAKAMIDAGLARYSHRGVTRTLVATTDGLRAVGHDPAPKPAGERKQRAGTKQAKLIEMLQRPEGTTIAEVTEQTGWQPHTVRGAIAGAIKKKLGLPVTTEKVEGRGTVYRIAS